jgi:chromosome segregation ATPase
VEQLIYKEREAVKKVITEKSNQITQLYKLFQGTAGIFQKQHNYVDKLKKNLEEEAKDKNLSQEKAKHLEEDIQRLDQQKKELEEKIKELEKGEKESKEIRDKELNELKEKVANLTAQLETVQKVDAEVYKVLEEYSTQKGLLLRSQEVAKKLKEAESKVLNKQELEVVSSITQFSTSAFFNIESILQTMTEVGNL